VRQSVWRWTGLTEPSSRIFSAGQSCDHPVHLGEEDGYSLTRSAFAPPGPRSQSLPSNVSPIQKFLWWDSAITEADRGKKFTYTVTPVRGTGLVDIRLHDEATSKPVEVPVPTVGRDNIWTWFNRAVVSSQSFSKKSPDPVSGHHFQINNLDGTGGIASNLVMPVSLLWTPKAL
jgi:hypothetical protein